MTIADFSRRKPVSISIFLFHQVLIIIYFYKEELEYGIYQIIIYYISNTEQEILSSKFYYCFPYFNCSVENAARNFSL